MSLFASKWKKLNLSIIPFGTLAHIELAPTLRDLIIAAQKKDKGMKKIERRITAEDPGVQCFHQDSEGVIWFEDRIVVPKDFELRKQILMKPIFHDYRYILAVIRCTKI